MDGTQTIRSLLLSKAQGLESNADIAWYYINNLVEVDKYGGFVNQEALLEKFTPDDVRNVARQYLIPSNMAYVKSKPTLTSNQFYLLAVFVFIIIIFFSWWLGKRIGIHIQSMRKTRKR